MQKTTAAIAAFAATANAWRSGPVVTNYRAREDFGANGRDHGFG